MHKQSYIPPQTSLDAYEQGKPYRNSHYEQIIRALEQIPKHEGIADMIACYCRFDKVEVSRRLNEMESKGMIVNTGRTGITFKGRKAAIYALKKETDVVSVPGSLFE